MAGVGGQGGHFSNPPLKICHHKAEKSSQAHREPHTKSPAGKVTGFRSSYNLIQEMLQVQNTGCSLQARWDPCDLLLSALWLTPMEETSFLQEAPVFPYKTCGVRQESPHGSPPVGVVLPAAACQELKCCF